MPHAAEVRNYQHEGQMRYHYAPATMPVHATNSVGGPAADGARAGEVSWETDGALVRAAQTLRSDDSDFGQAGTLYRDVFDEGQKAAFLETLKGQGAGITVPEIRERFFWYWGQVDAGLGEQLRAALSA